MVDGAFTPGFYIFSMDLTEHWVLVHPHSEKLCGAALPGSFAFKKKQHLLAKHKIMIFSYLSMSVYQNLCNLLLTRGTTIKTGILTLLEFWWVP